MKDHTRKHRKPSCTTSVTGQSLSVAAHVNLPEVNLLQARVTSQKNARALKMHSGQPGCYGHVIGEIQLVCQIVKEDSSYLMTSRTIKISISNRMKLRINCGTRL